MSHEFHSPTPATRPRPSTGRWALVGFLLIAAFFLLTEHRAHFLGILPWLLLLACPFLHFLHRGHGGHGRTHEGRGTEGPADTRGDNP